MTINDLARRLDRLAGRNAGRVLAVRIEGALPEDADATAGGLTWHREPGETDAAFEARVMIEAQRARAHSVVFLHADAG